MSRRQTQLRPVPRATHPCTSASERGLIAAVVAADSKRVDGKPAIDIIGDVRGEALVGSFSVPDLGHLWKLLCERHRRGELNDLIAVAELVRGAGIQLMMNSLRASDIASWMTELVEFMECGLVSLARRYANEIRDAAFRRARMRDAHMLIDSLQTDQRPVAEWYGEATATLLASPQAHQAEPDIGAVVVDVMTEIEGLIESGKTAVPGLTTGLKNLDRQLGGLTPGDLIVVAGRTGMGKTAFGITVTLNTARAGNGVTYFSIEMNKRSVGRRLVSQITGIELSRLARGPLAPDHYPSLAAGAEELALLPIRIVDSMRAWPAIAEECRRLVARGSKLIVLDYLGLISVPGADVNRWEMIGTITAEAKQLALSLDVPVLLLCQLNRESTRDPGKRPQLWHLRDSGCVEQDADIVLLLHREGATESVASRSGPAEIIVAKFRNGPTGIVSARWIAELARLEDARLDLVHA